MHSLGGHDESELIISGILRKATNERAPCGVQVGLGEILRNDVRQATTERERRRVLRRANRYLLGLMILPSVWLALIALCSVLAGVVAWLVTR
jgi:hypothetical protein